MSTSEEPEPGFTHAPFTFERILDELQAGEPFSPELLILLNRVVRGLSQATSIAGMSKVESTPTTEDAFRFQATFSKAMQVAREERLANDAIDARRKLTELLQAQNEELVATNAALAEENSDLRETIHEMSSALELLAQERDAATSSVLRPTSGTLHEPLTKPVTTARFTNPLGAQAR